MKYGADKNPYIISVKVVREKMEKRKGVERVRVRLPLKESRFWRENELNLVRTGNSSFAFIKGRNGRGVPSYVCVGKTGSETGYWTMITGKKFAQMRPATAEEVKMYAQNSSVRLCGEVSSQNFIYLGKELCDFISKNGTYKGTYKVDVSFGNKNYIRIKRGGEGLPNMNKAQIETFGNIKKAQNAPNGSFSFKYYKMRHNGLRIPSCLRDLLKYGDVLEYETSETEGSITFHLPEQTCCACGKKTCRHKRLPVSKISLDAMKAAREFAIDAGMTFPELVSAMEDEEAGEAIRIGLESLTA